MKTSRGLELRDPTFAQALARAHLVTAARHYCKKDDLDRLTPAEIADLDRRLTTHVEQEKKAVTSGCSGTSARP